MSVHIDSRSTLGRLRGLLEVSRRAREERDLTRLVDLIAETISGSLGFGMVAICLYRPAEDDLEVTTVYGSDSVRAALLGTTARLETLRAEFSGRSEDALLVPMRDAGGELLGVVAVDDPDSGLHPRAEELGILVAYSEHVAAAIEGARDAAAAARDRAALARLFDVSASLVELDSVDAVLAAVAIGIGDALEFEKVAVCTLDAEGRFVPNGTAGWEPGDPGLDFWLTQPDLDVLLVPEFELEGCYLIENDVANALVGNRSHYASQRGGVGPRAWRRHWLLVPLVERDGSRRGFVWADDPVDAMLPSRERLQALRTFANQGTMALRAAHERQSEMLHHHVLDGSADLIALLGTDNRIVLASRAYADVLGYDPDALLGTLLSELVHPVDLAEARARVVDYVIAEPVTARLRHRDGRWVLVEGVTTPIRDENGDLKFKLVIARDVTERERLQDQLRQAQKMESIGRLAGGIAHDFNNLLTAIRGYAELSVLEVEADAPVRENLEQIARASGRAAELTGQLLAYSRKQVLRPQVLDLNTVVGGMAPMLARILGEDVVLSTALEAELEPTRADPAQVEQVVLNLAVNARDAMPEGGRLLLRTANMQTEDGPRVALVVADTGSGMDETTAAQIFEPFFTTKPVGEGTGLGLATVHGIVAQSGGVIAVESEPGIGTTFTVSLPLAAQSE